MLMFCFYCFVFFVCNRLLVLCCSCSGPVGSAARRRSVDPATVSRAPTRARATPLETKGTIYRCVALQARGGQTNTQNRPYSTHRESKCQGVHSLKKASGTWLGWIASHLTTRSSCRTSLVKMLWNSMSLLPFPVGGSCSLPHQRLRGSGRREPGPPPRAGDSRSPATHLTCTKPSPSSSPTPGMRSFRPKSAARFSMATCLRLSMPRHRWGRPTCLA